MMRYNLGRFPKHFRDVGQKRLLQKLNTYDVEMQQRHRSIPAKRNKVKKKINLRVCVESTELQDSIQRSYCCMQSTHIQSKGNVSNSTI